MKIILCSPFYNENLVSSINIKESSKWVDEIHISECNKSFKYTPHEYCFDNFSPKVKYHKLDGNKIYKPIRSVIPYIDLHPISRWMNKVYKNTSWYNEGSSRNHTLWNSEYEDNDILILSDIDEVIDPIYADEIIEGVKKYDIVTINLHFSMYYFNLFCKNWSGPANYSYRIFVTKGGVLRKQFYNDSDYLRKLGENSKIINQVHCLPGFKGFHFSWIGNEQFVLNKLKSYAHTLSDHSSDIITNRQYDINKIQEYLRKGKSIFPDRELQLDNSILLPDSLEELRESNSNLFL